MKSVEKSDVQADVIEPDPLDTFIIDLNDLEPVEWSEGSEGDSAECQLLS